MYMYVVLYGMFREMWLNIFLRDIYRFDFQNLINLRYIISQGNTTNIHQCSEYLAWF